MFQRNGSFDFDNRSPLINLDSMLAGKSPNPYAFEIAADFNSMSKPMTADAGPMIDFDGISPDDGSFVLGALPLVVPPGDRFFFDDPDRFHVKSPLPPSPQQNEASPVIQHEEPAVVQPQPVKSEPVPMQMVETKAVAVELPAAKPGKNKKLNPRLKSYQLAQQLRQTLQEHSDKMDLELPLSEIAGLPVKLSKDAGTGEIKLGKYTLSQRKLRLEAFKKKFAHKRPKARRSKKPLYASRSKHARGRKRVGGRFTKKADQMDDD